MNEVRGFILEDCAVRGSIVQLEETWQHVTVDHAYSPATKQLLGDSLAATVLLTHSLAKTRSRVSIQLHGEGALKLLLTQCTEDLMVRGVAHSGPAAVGEPLLGAGRLAVNIDSGGPHGFFQGIVPLTSPNFDVCLEDYFARSEQLPTRIVFKRTERTIAGILLQAMPATEASDDVPTAEVLATAAAAANATPPDVFTQASAETLLPRIFSHNLIRLFAAHPVLHDCRCTSSHMAGIVRMLGEDELESLLVDEGRVELTCDFCNRAFAYGPDEVKAILAGDAPEQPLH